MFKPLPMQHVHLYVLRDDAGTAALALAEEGIFNPEEARELETGFPDLPGRPYQQLYRTAQARADKILSHLGLTLDSFPTGERRIISQDELATINDHLGELWRQCSAIQEEERRLEEEEKRVEQLNSALDVFDGLDTNLGLLQGHARFLDIHVGTLPAQNIHSLRAALGLAGYLVSQFRVVDGIAHAVVAGLPKPKRPVDLRPMFDAAGWRDLPLPAEFLDHPDELRKDLVTRRQVMEEGRATLQGEVDARYDQCGATLRDSVIALKLAAPYAELADVLRSQGGLSLVQGWVPKEAIATLETKLRERISNPFVLLARDPLPSERERVPSLIRHPHWLQSFAELVRNYGIPRYGEFNPTLWFAITFVAMFGMMFGDVGQGGAIAAAGIYYRQKLGHNWIFVTAIGSCSVLFGFLYGSIFGFETVIPALWLSPLHNPNRMLTLATYWAVFFILVGTILAIRNRLVEGHILEALLDSKGLAGILFYVGLLYGIGQLATGGEWGTREIAAIVVPFLLVLAYKWHHADFSVAEKILVVLIEGFETIMNYIANTLSFLRVAAFSLNHVALSIAVFTLADMMGTTGHWITVILGNVFILIVEGAIVAIQVLRLEYYEGFSRYFSGGGRDFRPLTIR